MKTILNKLMAVCALGIMLSACHKAEVVNISQPFVSVANGITSDTLKGTIKGTLLAGKTYYFKSDITVNDGDTLLLQSGVHLIAIGDGLSAATSPEIFMHGTFISLGTKDAPNFITVKNAADLHTQAAAQNYTNVFFGWWGGINCTPAAATTANPSPKGGDAIIKWTHIEFAGGPAGANDNTAIYPSGSPRYNIYFGNVTKNLIIEDSWFFGAKDDNIQVGGGHISIMRNTFELCGGVGGEFFNMKTGTLGDIAYNVFIGSATNATKISDSGTSGIQCTAAVYNNTMIDGGFRQTKSGRGGSIDFEKGARGRAYNNLIVNCRFGLRITPDADFTNVAYGNQYFYGYSPAIVAQFYSADGAPSVTANKAASDIYSTTPQANNPMFYAFDVNQYNFTANPGPLSANVQTYPSVAIGTSNLKLQSASPGLGKGKTDFSPLGSVTATGTYGTTITPPGKDIGAYQNDGTGNQH
ncbi:hypothetical protein [Mucilaginibacter jinjuensis]|uniref:Parallel beta helix pectate lyase-like protein n=1 Tax=Mucilaginibacter jinjuensis TaxID=1176721 RepID=A0ABY7TEA1_9SPHI|nr:hypothetical protein [Mucilaginibacter jinjuensis]WCT14636.1 hypothetical protein PQO05_11885 [Mucilaginibacter jinjuensis]